MNAIIPLPPPSTPPYSWQKNTRPRMSYFRLHLFSTISRLSIWLLQDWIPPSIIHGRHWMRHSCWMSFAVYLLSTPLQSLNCQCRINSYLFLLVTGFKQQITWEWELKWTITISYSPYKMDYNCLSWKGLSTAVGLISHDEYQLLSDNISGSFCRLNCFFLAIAMLLIPC